MHQSAPRRHGKKMSGRHDTQLAENDVPPYYMKMTSIELLSYSAALCFSSVIASGELHSEALELLNPLLFMVVIGSALVCLYPRTKKLASRFTRG